MFRKPNLRFCFYIFIFGCGVIFAVKVSFRFLGKYHILSKIFNFVPNSIDSSSRIELLESSFSFSFGGLSLKISESMFFDLFNFTFTLFYVTRHCVEFCLLSMSVIELSIFPASFRRLCRKKPSPQNLLMKMSGNQNYKIHYMQ